MRRSEVREPVRTGGGFTLLELLIVIVIIGLVVAFILTVAVNGIRRAEERATQALVTKLDVGVTDRLEAILTQTPTVSPGHRFLASIWLDAGGALGVVQLPGEQRAEAIARADMVRAEMPDVFYVQVNPSTLTATSAVYPLNFGGVPYPSTTSGVASYVLPLGHCTPAPYGAGNVSGGTPTSPGIGIYGASYAVAAGIYKSLGYLPRGYDTVNNNGNGLVNEFSEGVNATNLELVRTRLQNHLGTDSNTSESRKTARAEMLYALLVEGRGPLGSMFSRDQFTDREVQDIDKDGLPEFVNAWGQPIQFYRWPTHYAYEVDGTAPYTYFQKGWFAYGVSAAAGALEPRQQNPLDPNQTLVPAGLVVVEREQRGTREPFVPLASLGMSGQAAEFMRHFFSIVNPWAGIGAPGGGQLWDRSGAFGRRAYFSKFLVVSSGPDRKLGIAQLNLNYAAIDDTTLGRDSSGGPVALGPTPPSANDPRLLTLIENQAATVEPARSGPLLQQVSINGPSGGVNSTYTYMLTVGQDDISNHNLQAPGGGIR